ncbi:SDR family oxidoreductase [Herbaspirillum sp. RU 5E]|uniref:UDP-glucose 4-epimerase family protein n=1 Tax=Herbaspirillum sp. CAH-3 TaxID=2605746 RepID=UPI0012ACCB30|nr:SDR family oxidoreductase [Herbaspirillum sp. CAH-3]MBW9333432.1 SDR family oxidoreductase [Herbaspirillum sp. RU 5E]MRT28569.1 SDR family oxidoreductase [Herbaspirillum sp. CAH-3]
MNILITGATGFVGSAVLARLIKEPGVSTARLRAAVRRPPPAPLPGVEYVLVGDLNEDTDWRNALEGIDAVIHCAARVHVMHDTAANPMEEFRRTNVNGTLSLAQQAHTAGVKRFIFISSVKVNGEATLPGAPFSADDMPTPSDPYGISKLEAERQLFELGTASTMEVVAIRPVLVYGPGVKANFLSMMRWIDKGVPLPLGGITRNQRSLVALPNLVDLIVVCLRHPAAAGQVFLASDGEDLSTSALLRRTARALNKRPILLPVPASMLALGARALGKPGLAQRLCGSLQVDIGKNRALLGWSPPVSVDTALKETADAYRCAD